MANFCYFVSVLNSNEIGFFFDFDFRNVPMIKRCFPIKLLSLGFSGSSSRSATPTPQRKSPTTDAGVQVSVEVNDSGPDPRIEARNQMKQRTRDQSQMNYQSQRRVPSTARRQDSTRRSNLIFLLKLEILCPPPSTIIYI